MHDSGDKKLIKAKLRKSIAETRYIEKYHGSVNYIRRNSIKCSKLTDGGSICIKFSTHSHIVDPINLDAILINDLRYLKGKGYFESLNYSFAPMFLGGEDQVKSEECADKMKQYGLSGQPKPSNFLIIHYSKIKKDMMERLRSSPVKGTNEDLERLQILF